ncbi:MAG: AEC family transporter [Gemmatimonadota bacterium]
MSTLVTTIAPVFGVIVLGFLAVRLGLFGPTGAQRLVRFVFNLAIPAMLFHRLARIDFPDHIEWAFLLAYYASAFLAYGAGMAVARFRFGRPRDEQAIYGMGAGFSNTVLLGIPLLLTAFGPEAELPVFMIIAFHSITLLPVTVALIQSGRPRTEARPGVRWARLVGEILANPIIVGILLGLLVNALGTGLWAPLDATAALLATVAIPCALFALGASLAGYPLQGELGPAAALATLKLVLQPVLAWILAVPVLGLGAPWAAVAVVMASLPSGAMVYLFGARYDAAQGVAAKTVLVASAVSVVTISVWLVVMG